MVNVKTLSKLELINPSGKSLSLAVTGLILLTAILFDWFTGRLGKLSTISLPWLICTIASGILGLWIVPILQQLKTGQIVREDGPQAHLSKAGTPTMGGIFFVPVTIIVASIWCQFKPETIAVCLVTLGYAFIGWLDDWQVLRRQSNKGISPKMKLLLQITIAVSFCLWVIVTQSSEITNVTLPGNLILAFGWLFWPLAGFVLVAESNATNLTDGVDGLAAGTSAIAFAGLGVIIASTSPDLAVFSICMSGACVGFLFHNRNRAKVFMGDTGSLALGGALAAVGILSHNLWALFLVSGVFFVESLSVIAQVAFYKATKNARGEGKRLFKMAPIHHHFELSGWSETQVVGVFYLVNIFLVIVAYLLH